MPRHNPERRAWRGKSYREGGNGPRSAKNVRDARDKSARKVDKARETDRSKKPGSD